MSSSRNQRGSNNKRRKETLASSSLAAPIQQISCVWCSVDLLTSTYFSIGPPSNDGGGSMEAYPLPLLLQSGTGRLLCRAYDNIGFWKIKGYVQYTLLSILFFLVWRLITIGVYPDPAMDPTAAKNHLKYRSNVSPDWEGVKDNYTF